MIQDIQKHIELADGAIAWANEFGKDSFPFDRFKDYRRKLRKIKSSLEEKCSAAAYGESQVGKSYLMSSLLSSPDAPFVITHKGRDYSFIDELNPSGGNNAKVESTGVITRFTIATDANSMSDFVKVRNLSVVDIILLLANAYYNDIKINQDTTLRYDVINQHLEGLSNLWSSHIIQQTEIDEDDIKDISEYLHDVIGNAAIGVNQSSFCRIVGPVIKYVSCDKWVDVFSLLWNKNDEISHMFSVLINEYKKIGFKTDIYIPFDAVLREKGTILKIQWLDTVCGVQVDTGNDDLYTDIYDVNGNVVARDFGKGYLSALIAEITFELPEHIVEDRPFLKKMDLLDFPGARGKEEYKEDEIHAVLPTLLRRGKVAYLFNKYSRSLRISSVLFCFHNDQKAAPIGGTINSWIADNIGATPEERTAMLSDTNGISPLFLVATKFNLDLERAKTDNLSNISNLSEHWKRFKDVLPEIIKPSRWLTDWVVSGGLFRSSAFQNIYPLRDFYWSGKNGVFDGYSDGNIKSEEKAVHVYPDYPEYFENLKDSFLQNEFVKKHFADPAKTWNDVATVNNDGSKAIIRNLGAIAGVLDNARQRKYLTQLKQMKEDMYRSLSVYFEPEEQEAKNKKVQQIASDIKMSLFLSVGKSPETFGKIIDTLMVPVSDLREIAYNIVICHTDTPTDFSIVSFVRQNAGIDPNDDKDLNIQKLCTFFGCNKNRLEDALKEQGCSIAEVVSSKTETLTTVADVVVKHIINYWNTFINNQIKTLDSLIPHADEIVFMLAALLKKLEVRKELSKRIDRYCKVFSLNEQPNAIADYASLTLNNFVSSIGRNYINESEVVNIKVKAEKCHIQVNLQPEAWKQEQKPKPLLQTLKAFDEATDINKVGMQSLTKLPLWDNFQRWENLVTIGLLYTSDISNVDPVANTKLKELLDSCVNLYK
ncbi:virulence factor SrfC family protein [uncultured Bacteroides sp.]|uniref:virulence factor SrfC family protein n=1 Tax=uncultured Bacteroides sp. TaxID=162156 RepID=UPI002601D028|nr:virulence factor SrfC family protein [uncultured Bacteroides sp.]